MIPLPRLFFIACLLPLTGGAEEASLPWPRQLVARADVIAVVDVFGFSWSLGNPDPDPSLAAEAGISPPNNFATYTLNASSVIKGSLPQAVYAVDMDPPSQKAIGLDRTVLSGPNATWLVALAAGPQGLYFREGPIGLVADGEVRWTIPRAGGDTVVTMPLAAAIDSIRGMLSSGKPASP